MNRTNRVAGGGEVRWCSDLRWIRWRRETRPWAQMRPAKHKQWGKKHKARAERRKARLNPEAPPSYGLYRGWDD